MPRIAAATVAEHRAQVEAALVDAAERLLRAEEPLTAAAVTRAAGIARNSIYRYVDSIDDLRHLVVARHLPDWVAAVTREVHRAEGPAARIRAFVSANITQAARSGHGWLMGVARDAPPRAGREAAVDDAHAGMRTVLTGAWAQLVPQPDRAAVAAALTQGLLDAAFRELDAGRPVDVVLAVSGQAVDGLLGALAGHPG